MARLNPSNYVDTNRVAKHPTTDKVPMLTPKHHFSALQRSGIRKWKEVCAQIKLANENYDAMRKAGLEREAKNTILPKINDLVKKRDEMERRLSEQCQVIARALLVVFAACDIATVAVEMFYDTIEDNDATEADGAIRDLIRSEADRWNEIVQIIDEGRSERLSMLYADMAEEVTKAALPVIEEIVNKYQQTPEGQKLF